MKQALTFLALLFAALALSAFAQESTEAELNRLEDLRYESMKNVDEATLDKIFTEDFVYQTLQGKTHTKQSYIASLKTGDVKINAFKRENSRVKFYGDTATVMATAHLDIVLSGEAKKISLFYLNVWAKRDGRWQLVARQSTALPKPQ
jgi:ketosteroid isomerase-like protein